jgi:hypothetical protein
VFKASFSSVSVSSLDVSIDLRQSPYSARVEFEKVYSNPADHPELKRDRPQ